MSTPPRRQNTEDFARIQSGGTGKGIPAEARSSSPALGMRENTRMTVTVREALFTELIFG